MLTTGELLDLIKQKLPTVAENTQGEGVHVHEYLTSLRGMDNGMDVDEGEAKEPSLTLEGGMGLLSGVSPDGEALVGSTAEGGGSGGYLDHIFRYAARTLYGVQVSLRETELNAPIGFESCSSCMLYSSGGRAAGVCSGQESGIP